MWGDWNYSGPVQSWRQVARLQQIEFSRHRPYLLFIDELGTSMRNPHLLKSVVSLCLVASLAILCLHGAAGPVKLASTHALRGFARSPLQAWFRHQSNLVAWYIFNEYRAFLIQYRSYDRISIGCARWLMSKFSLISYIIQHSRSKMPKSFRPFAHTVQWYMLTN